MAINSYKEDEQTKEISKWVLFRRLFKYLTKYWKTITFILALIVFRTVVRIINPLFMEAGIDDYISVGDFKGLLILGLIITVINILTVISVKIRIFITEKVTSKVVMEIRQELYNHIQYLDFKFFDSRPTGKILSRIIQDVNSLKNFIQNCITTLIPELGTVIAVLIIMFIKNAKLAAFSLLSIPVLLIGIYFAQIKGRKKWQIVRKKSSNYSAFIHEDLSGIKVVQQFNAENETNEESDQLSKDHRKSFIHAILYSDVFFANVNFTQALGTALLYFAGIKIVGTDNISVGTYIAFGTYLTMFWDPISELASFYNQLISNVAAAERVFEVLDTKAEIKDKENAVELPEVKGEVTFDNVSFGYNETATVLKDLSFNIKPGETIALVGPTGAGKTTVVNLISRFYDVTGGAIKIDGNDVRDVKIESLRRQMGVMTQDTYLFSGTIKENIRYGRLDATDEEIIEAAKAVHAHEFISSLPKGYDTELTERGGGLSNGQKQMVAFARAMINKPKILILDEATSSIDTKTEILVQSGIEAMLKGRTSFVIAHRLSTIKNADRIFVINKQGIVEQGTPDELMALKGEYYNLYMAQFKEIA